MSFREGAPRARPAGRSPAQRARIAPRGGRERGRRGAEEGSPRAQSRQEDQPMSYSTLISKTAARLGHPGDCQREPNSPQAWELKIPHPGYSDASVGWTRPALSLSLSL
jgi:hypothetical protein